MTTFSAFDTPVSWPTGAPAPPSGTPSRSAGRPAEAQLGIPLAAVSGGAR
ncbi:hypothetical protein [Streptomyces goshikiensis]